MLSFPCRAWLATAVLAASTVATFGAGAAPPSASSSAPAVGSSTLHPAADGLVPLEAPATASAQPHAPPVASENLPESEPEGAARTEPPAQSPPGPSSTHGTGTHARIKRQLPDCICRHRRPRRRRERHFEASFGSAELFTNQSVTDPAGLVRERVIPITALNLLGEWLVYPRLGVMVQFLLPLEPEATLVDDELTLKYIPPALSGGIRFSVFEAEVIEDTVLEGQLFGLVGSTIAALDGNEVYPTAAWRLHLRERRGFTVYLGASFAFRQNTTALLYGVGNRF